jgi:hypothetical protein
MAINFSILLPKANPGARGGGVFGAETVGIVVGRFARPSAELTGWFANVDTGSGADKTNPKEFLGFIAGLL